MGEVLDAQVTCACPIPKPRMPYLALRCNENSQCSARTLKDTELGAHIAIKPGSHALGSCRVPREDFIRAAKTRSLFGKTLGHGILSDEHPVLFAGEIETNEDSQLVRWNNVSGTYRFHEQHASQAELPLDRFWGLVEDTEEPMRAEEPNDWVRVCDGLRLQNYEETALSEQVQYHIAQRCSTTQCCTLPSACCRCSRARRCTLVCLTLLVRQSKMIKS